MHRLLFQLEQEQFSLTTSDRMRVQQLLAAYSDKLLTKEGKDDLKYLLAPVLAKNAVEQERFYQIYDAYLEDLKAFSEAEKAEIEEEQIIEEKTKFKKILLASLALLTLIALGSILKEIFKPPPPPRRTFDFHDSQKRSEIPYGDTIKLENLSQAKDTSDVHFTWEWMDSRSNTIEAKIENQFHWEFKIPHSETYHDKHVHLIARHKKTNNIDTIKRQFTVVCPNPPQTLEPIFFTPSQPVLGDEVAFSVLTDSVDNYLFAWDFGDSSTSNEVEPKHKYEKEGNYIIDLSITRKEAALGKCVTEIQTSISVQNKGRSVPIFSEYPLELDVPPVHWIYTRLPWFLLFLLSSSALYFWWKWWKKPKEQEQKKKAQTKQMEQRFRPVDKAPYSIPFQSQEEVIEVAGEQFQLGNALRNRQEGSRQEINVNKTLQATIEQGGFPSLHFSYNTKATDYLFLIDSQTPASHQARLFQYLAEMFQEQDVHIDIFHYQKDFDRLWSPAFPEGVNLDKLHRLYENRRLVVFGDAYALLENNAEDEILNTSWRASFSKWKEKILVTPTPLISWTYKEARLYQLFPIFTGDLTGLLKAAAFIEQGMSEEDLPNTLRDWEAELEKSQIDRDVNRRWRNYKDHQDYLKNNPEVLRWFRSLVVYPEMEWNVTLAVGKALGLPVTYDNLLLLARIPWLQEGELKLKLWRELWEVLPLEDEWTARAAVEKELELVRSQTNNSFSNQKLEKELAVQKFAQEPTDPKNKEAIRYLQDNNLIDNLRLEELDLVIKRQVAQFENGDKRGQTLELFLKKKETKLSLYRPPFWTAVSLSLLTLLLSLFLLFMRGDRLNDFMESRNLPLEQTAWLGLVQKENLPERKAMELNNNAVKDYYGTRDISLLTQIIKRFGRKSEIKKLDKKLNKTEEINVDSIYFENNMWYENPKTQAALLQLDSALVLEPDYHYPKINRAKLFFNAGISEFKKLSENKEIEDSLAVFNYFNKAAEHDSLHFEALNALGLVHHFVGNQDSVCAIVDRLSVGAYALEHSTQRLLEVTACPKNVAVRLHYNKELPKAALSILEEKIRARGFSEIIKIERKTTDNTIEYLDETTKKRPANENYIHYTEEKDQALAEATTRLLQDWVKQVNLVEEIGGFKTELLQGDPPKQKANSDFNIWIYYSKKVEPKPESQAPETDNTEAEVVQIDPTRPGEDIDVKPVTEIDEQKEKDFLFALDSIRKDILVLDYEAALKKAVNTTKLGPLRPEVGMELSEIAFWFNETNQIGRASGVLDTLAQLVGDKKLSNRLKQAPRGDTLLIRNYLRETLKSINNSHYNSLFTQKYYPEMVKIKGGTFEMGCHAEYDEDCDDDETKHLQTVSDFEIAKYETTWWQYRLFCEATGHEYRSPGWGIQGDNPAVYLSWYDVTLYANWVSGQKGLEALYRQSNKREGDYGDEYDIALNSTGGGSYRLPTEAEWEYAARGGQDPNRYINVYSGSSNLDSVGWYEENSKSRTHTVGKKGANALGLYDMSGNVWEWCWDSKGDYPTENIINYKGGKERNFRVLRGGSWFNLSRVSRVSYRVINYPDLRDNDIGVRLSRASYPFSL